MNFRLVALTLLVACSCEEDPMMLECTNDTDCVLGSLCVDNMCVVPMDAAIPDAGPPRTDAGLCQEENLCGAMCCNDGEECVDGFQCLPICETTRCGDNGILCCDAGDICLDGVVCAADCAPEETLCGADSNLCCPEGDVCVADACITPGIECANDFDCRDPSLYCEPTIGSCLPTGAGGDMCEVRPEFEEIAVTEEWHFEGVMVGGSLYNQVINSPVVGDVSGDGIPDVVVPFYTGTNWTLPVIVGLSGDTGEPLFTIDRSVAPPDSEGVALANFDDDEALEFVYRIDGGGIRMMDGDGVTELARRDGDNLRGNIEFADFNQDGTPDVVVGCRVYDGRDITNPAMDIIDAGSCPMSGWESPVVADLDGDGQVELTNGNIALNHDGTELWNTEGGGLVAIADLDADGTPEVIIVGAGTVSVKSGATGAMLIGPGGAWHDAEFAIPGGGTGGSPTVADFDGDGLPEIATAGRGNYVVYDPDCFETPMREDGEGGDACAGTEFIRWQTPTQDISSSVTGSSVFDFQGDGIAEVVYNDECFLHIYDGRDGTELLMDPIPNSSRTGFEYPIVVDVDADGNSEIVVVANNDQAVIRDFCPAAYSETFGVEIADLPPEYAAGTAGVFVYGDAFDSWVPTRPIWNQYSYHVTNTSDFGEVPAMEADNWTTPGLNNYRQNVQGEGIFNAPNLQAELEAAGECSAGAIRLSAIVRNQGSRGVPAGISVEFWRTDVDPEVLIGTAVTTGPLLPGGRERVTVTAMDVPTDVDLMFEVRIDPAVAPETGDAIECVEDDNSAVATDMCPGLL
ncbi:MAG: FG-GAP-like repeat-containing protein [Polyangiales bacterium]